MLLINLSKCGLGMYQKYHAVYELLDSLRLPHLEIGFEGDILIKEYGDVLDSRVVLRLIEDDRGADTSSYPRRAEYWQYEYLQQKYGEKPSQWAWHWRTKCRRISVSSADLGLQLVGDWCTGRNFDDVLLPLYGALVKKLFTHTQRTINHHSPLRADYREQHEPYHFYKSLKSRDKFDGAAVRAAYGTGVAHMQCQAVRIPDMHSEIRLILRPINADKTSKDEDFKRRQCDIRPFFNHYDYDCFRDYAIPLRCLGLMHGPTDKDLIMYVDIKAIV